MTSLVIGRGKLCTANIYAAYLVRLTILLVSQQTSLLWNVHAWWLETHSLQVVSSSLVLTLLSTPPSFSLSLSSCWYVTLNEHNDWGDSKTSKQKQCILTSKWTISLPNMQSCADQSHHTFCNADNGILSGRVMFRYQLMLDCWASDAESRPTFASLQHTLEASLMKADVRNIVMRKHRITKKLCWKILFLPLSTSCYCSCCCFLLRWFVFFSFHPSLLLGQELPSISALPLPLSKC